MSVISPAGLNHKDLDLEPIKNPPVCILCLLTLVSIILILLSGCTSEPKYDPLIVSGDEKVIADFRAGKIIIGAKSYFSSDIIISPDHVKYNWYGLHDHIVKPETISDVINSDIKVLIIGTGAQNGVSVPKATIEYLESIGIKTCVMDTWKAVEFYDKSKREKLAAVLHLNC